MSLDGYIDPTVWEDPSYIAAECDECGDPLTPPGKPYVVGEHAFCDRYCAEDFAQFAEGGAS